MEMHRQAALAIAALTALGGCGESPSPPPASLQAEAPPFCARPVEAKPTPPLDLDLWFESEPRPGATVRVGLAVIPRVDLPDAELSFGVPEEIPVVEGRREWRGALARDRRQAIFLTVRVPETGSYSLRGRAQAAFPDGTRLNRVAALAVPPSTEPGAGGRQASSKASPDSEGVLKTNDRGETIREFPAESPK